MLDFSTIRKQGRRLAFVVDATVFRLYPDLFQGELCVLVEAREEKKSWETVVRIINELMAMEVDRHDLLVGVGGGITMDLCGFVASIYKRGVEVYYVPTTLLGIVDASLGGKNGINWNGCKNEVGTIRIPQRILCDFDFLKTLPEREFYSGVGEMLKVFLLADPHAYEEAVALFRGRPGVADLMEGISCEKLKSLINRASKIKMQIVDRDVQEKGERRLLNFGHTFGHAIELLSDGLECVLSLTHGEAVVWGMAQMIRWSVSRYGLAAEEAGQILADFRAMGFSTFGTALLQAGFQMDPVVCIEQLKRALRQDKKREGTVIHAVFLRRKGEPVLEEVPLQEMERVLEDLQFQK